MLPLIVIIVKLNKVNGKYKKSSIYMKAYGFRITVKVIHHRITTTRMEDSKYTTDTQKGPLLSAKWLRKLYVPE